MCWRLLLAAEWLGGLLLAGVAVVIVGAILRVSLHLTKRQFLLVWGLLVPALVASIPQLLPVFVLVPLGMLWLVVGLWVYHRWWPVGVQPVPSGLHTAHFAGYRDVSALSTPDPPADGLLLGRHSTGEYLSVRPLPARRELGNLLLVGPTRSGKGLLATSQLLTWRHSVVVNDIKGELFAATAGHRATLGNVYVLDPTGVGHRFDPLASRVGEDALFAAASFLRWDRSPLHHRIWRTWFLIPREKRGVSAQFVRDGIRVKLSSHGFVCQPRPLPHRQEDLPNEFVVGRGCFGAWISPMNDSTS